LPLLDQATTSGERHRQHIDAGPKRLPFAGVAHYTMRRKQPDVLGLDLKCSEL
jgi:hypothetical protein